MQLKTYGLLMVAAIWAISIYAQERIGFSNTIKVDATDTEERIIEKAAHVIPTTRQMNALRNEFIAFIHFGPNTFTAVEWGSGKEDPRVFDLKELHTDQWCEIMKDAGMRRVVLTVKHHDGFVLWQSRYTKHGIMSTGYKDGKGDILAELAASCRKYGLKLGVYLSPADLFQIEDPQGLYGNLSKYTKRTIPRAVPDRPFASDKKFEFVVDDYNEYFLNQLYELLTEYGPIDEVWFDGAHPKRKGGQTYNYGAWRELIRTLAPNAVVFGKEDIRWCGNEGGGTRNTEWNVIPYEEDPNTMNDFRDLTDSDLGSREVLLSKQKPYYLHYQPAETNTSIRAGWFYANDTHQKVRSADDVFDIYERAVGGNSIFLLNIPPNREGKFSERDELVLREVGKRIRETYSNDLLEGADGPQEILDGKDDTYLLLNGPSREIVLSTKNPIKINRIAIREPVALNGERVARHIVDAFIDDEWQEIAEATNVGYRRILRFPTVETTKIRIRIPESRLVPAISSVSAYYYNSRPPMLGIRRDNNGLITVEPKSQQLNWNITGQNSEKNLNAGYKIYYTTDESVPDQHANEYTEPFFMERGELKAISWLNGNYGPVMSEPIGLPKSSWKVLAVSSELDRRQASAAIDANPQSFWMTESAAEHFISFDLGKVEEFRGFAYTPQTQSGNGMVEKGLFQVSQDGKTWTIVEPFEFGNLINDPVKRHHYFKNPVKSRYIRLQTAQIAGGGDTASMAEFDLY